MRRRFALLGVPIVAVLLTACGSSKKAAATSSTPAATSSSSSSSGGYGSGSSSTSSSSSSSATGTKISSATVTGLGPILVNAQGKTLYTFAPDKAKAVTCKGACAGVWPPATLSGAKATAAGAVKQSLLGADAGPSGGKVVTYAGWPLYSYVGDQGPGSANGQAKNITGGLWYVISPSGKVITKMP